MRARTGRRTKPSVLRRLRVFWLFIVVVLPLCVYGGYRLATWKIFEPKSIDVTGNVHVPAAEVLRLAAIRHGENVWLLNKGAAEHRIESIPWVRVAQIHRSLPARVRIVIAERRPAACLISSGAEYLVDEGAHVIESSCPAGDLVRVAFPPVGAQRPGAVLDARLLARMLADAAILRSAQLDATVVGLGRFGGLDVRLRDGVRVRFGDDADLARKAGLVRPIESAYEGRLDEIAAIDVRAPRTPVVQLRRPKR